LPGYKIKKGKKNRALIINKTELEQEDRQKKKKKKRARNKNKARGREVKEAKSNRWKAFIYHGEKLLHIGKKGRKISLEEANLCARQIGTEKGT